MKKTLLFAFACMFAFANADAQRILLDFDNERQMDGLCFGTGGPDNFDCINVIANPDASGINESDSVAAFIEPAAGETWMGAYFDVINNGMVDLTVATGNTMLCADVWTATSVPFTFKAENPDNGAAPFEGGRIMPSATSSWVTVCDDMVVFDNMASRLVFFFNIDAVPAAETTYYMDNVTQPGATSVGGLIEAKGLEVYPNPATYNLLWNADGEPMTVIVSDVAGREMFRHTNYTDNNIRVADLTPGLYIATFIDEATGQFGSTKFMKK